MSWGRGLPQVSSDGELRCLRMWEVLLSPNSQHLEHKKDDVSLVQIHSPLSFILFWNPLFLDVAVVYSNVRQPYHL